VAIALCCGVTGYLRLYGLEYEDAFEYVASARLWAERPNAANVLNTYCVALAHGECVGVEHTSHPAAWTFFSLPSVSTQVVSPGILASARVAPYMMIPAALLGWSAAHGRGPKPNATLSSCSGIPARHASPGDPPPPF